MPANLLMGSTSGVVGGVFTGTISVGTAIVAIILLSVAGYFASRLKLAEQAQKQTEQANEAASTWRDNYLAEKVRADDFEKRWLEQRAAKHEVITQLAAEKLKTDQTVVLKALDVTQRALREFHAEFVAREAEAARVRATVVATEERMIGQLAEIAAQLAQMRR